MICVSTATYLGPMHSSGVRGVSLTWEGKGFYATVGRVIVSRAPVDWLEGDI